MKFEGEIDWNFQSHGKLWNYNLQYFDYLQDSSFSDVEKQRLIEEFATSVLKKKVKPEPYPTSLRLINWIIYYSQSGYSSAQFEKALKYQVDYLENNLEYHLLANHILENYFALLVCGYSLRDKKLTMKAFRGLHNELERQVLKDGAHYECSPMYHCIILSKLLMIIDVINANQWVSIDADLMKTTAEKMLGWLKAFCFEDGSYAHFNDSTDDVAPRPSVLFGSAAKVGLHVSEGSLGDSGYRKFTNQNYEVITDAGEIVPAYQPGHAHSDMMSFCVNYKKSPFLADMGTSTYEKNERRHFERSTSAHNCVTINNVSQSEVWGSFRVGRRAGVSILKDDVQQLRARHTGYMRNYNCLHEREFNFSEDKIAIFDFLTNDKQVGTSFFYLDHSKKLPVKTDNKYLIEGVGTLQFRDALKEEVLEYEQAVGFNRLEKGYCIKVSFKNQLATTIEFK